MTSAITFILLFITPFIIAPFGITQFENPKVIFAEAGIILLLVFKLFLDGKFPKNKILFIATLLLIFADLVFFKNQNSIFGNVFRLQGIVMLWFMLIFSFVSSGDRLNKIYWYVYLALLLLELAGTLYFSVNENNRFVGTLGEPNATAAFVIFLWPFGFFGIRKWGFWEKIGQVAMFAITITILALTGSRSAMIAFIIQLIFMAFYDLKISKIISFLTSIFIYLGSLVLPIFGKVGFENRADIWRSAIFANGNNFILGNGFGNLENALHISAKNLGLLVQYSYVDSSHNLFLDWWVQGGVIGLILLFGFVFLSFKKFYKEDNFREVVLLLGVVTVMSFNPASIATLLGFWWLIGQGFAPTENKYIEDFQNAKRVDQKQSNKPSYRIIFSRFPKSFALPEKAPNQKQNT